MLRRTALLAPHNQPVSGATAGTVGDFQINNTARNAGIIASETGRDLAADRRNRRPVAAGGQAARSRR